MLNGAVGCYDVSFNDNDGSINKQYLLSFGCKISGPVETFTGARIVASLALTLELVTWKEIGILTGYCLLDRSGSQFLSICCSALQIWELYTAFLVLIKMFFMFFNPQTTPIRISIKVSIPIPQKTHLYGKCVGDCSRQPNFSTAGIIYEGGFATSSKTTRRLKEVTGSKAPMDIVGKLGSRQRGSCPMMNAASKGSYTPDGWFGSERIYDLKSDQG